ncbi:hypothetical protein [Occultella gossypii]|uniref:Peptidase inhibitor family I36 n=1 Tax=Occultella gossypii TaxID=2800820 RepID=A0ABS7S8K8_9MICO|nr:hypothetical protein [Occultella gossypii]MBZ2195533.1 hypothetical protein [Occultella gossypii]
MTMANLRQRSLRMLAVLALALTAVAGVSGAAQASEPDPPGGEDPGCPSGAVCVYPGTDWNGGNPTYVFYSYGAHKIYNQYGVHRVYNNQTGGAGASMCSATNGTLCGSELYAGSYRDVYLTPINSIRLFE